MKLSEIFLEAKAPRDWPKNQDEVEQSFFDWLQGGKHNKRFQQHATYHSDLSVSITGDAEFGDEFRFDSHMDSGKRMYDHSTTLPFKIKDAYHDMIVDGMKKLNTLEGFPRKVGRNFTLRGCPMLTSLDNFPQDIAGDIVIAKCKGLRSLEGIPSRVGGALELVELPNIPSGFDNFPAYIGSDLYFIKTPIDSFIGIADKVKHIGGKCMFEKKEIKSGGLGLLLIEGLKKIDLISGNTRNTPWEIIEKYLGDADNVFECQQELIDAGFEEYAKL